MTFSSTCLKLWRPSAVIPVIVILIIILVILSKPSHVTLTPPLDQYWRVEEYVQLSAKDAFENLSFRRKSFAYHLNKAAWFGSFISAAQTSPESPWLMLSVLKALELGLDSRMENAGFSDEEKQRFRRYSCGILVNQGNYRGDNGFKFIPEEMDASKLEGFLNDVWPPTSNSSFDDLFSLTPSVLGFPPEGQTQFWRGMNPKETESVVRFMQSKGIVIGNQFAVKTSNASGMFVNVRFASQLNSSETWKWRDFVDGEPWENFAKISLSRGAFSALLTLVVNELNLALEFVEDPHMQNSLEFLVQSLKEGDLELHINSGVEWVKAVNQQVDTYMGFMENYRDPSNLQLEYSSFVGVEDHFHSEAFRILTNRSVELTSKLPWSSEFEPDTSRQTNSKSFSSILVTSYVANVLPRGVNLPNYEKVKLVGQKNFNIANVVKGKAKFLQMAFLDEQDSELLRNLYVEAFTIKLGIHELLGHGSGLILRKDNAGVPNFNENLIDPTTNAKIDRWYTPGKSFSTVFENIASAYEETRANSVALYLACDRDILAIFGHEGQKADDVCLAVYLNQVFSGFTALTYFDPKAGWVSAHAQSDFVILRALMERLPNFVQIEERGNQDVRITVNRSLIPSIAKESFEDFVQKIQIYRLTGNIQAAKELFSRYSAVDEKWEKLREIVVARKAGLVEPAFVQGNIRVEDGDDALDYKWIDYAESCDGLLSSWEERFSSEELRSLQEAVEEYLRDDA